jgi:hypothetical protein
VKTEGSATEDARNTILDKYFNLLLSYCTNLPLRYLVMNVVLYLRCTRLLRQRVNYKGNMLVLVTQLSDINVKFYGNNNLPSSMHQLLEGT